MPRIGIVAYQRIGFPRRDGTSGVIVFLVELIGRKLGLVRSLEFRSEHNKVYWPFLARIHVLSLSRSVCCAKE